MTFTDQRYANVKAVTVLLLAMMMLGCSGHSIAGKVVAGPESRIMVVDRHDHRLSEPGIFGASVSMVVDPNVPRPKEQGTVQTGEYGQFELDLNAFGAGVLEYELGIEARARGYEAVWQLLSDMPKRDQRLLIMLAPGQDAPARPKPVVEETLEMGQPWMQ